MPTFDQLLPDSDPQVEIVTVPSGPIQRASARRIEDEILADAQEVLLGAGSFHRIDPEWEAPPPEWIAALGQQRALERFRLAKYALASSKDAPVGLKLAAATHASITKARATEKSGDRVFNMTLVQMPASAVVYPEIEEKEK